MNWLWYPLFMLGVFVQVYSVLMIGFKLVEKEVNWFDRRILWIVLVISSWTLLSLILGLKTDGALMFVNLLIYLVLFFPLAKANWVSKLIAYFIMIALLVATEVIAAQLHATIFNITYSAKDITLDVRAQMSYSMIFISLLFLYLVHRFQFRVVRSIE